mmetsp:Transcript_86088/g.221691  ORF Transcript_86088/g.221691 Transcript_86088/m.221691 type:complete len:212 (-) Transcript_86088:403-1038(-)
MLHASEVQVCDGERRDGRVLLVMRDGRLRDQRVPLLLQAGAHGACRRPAGVTARASHAEQLQEVEQRRLLLGREVHRRERLVQERGDTDRKVLHRRRGRLGDALRWQRPPEEGRVLRRRRQRGQLRHVRHVHGEEVHDLQPGLHRELPRKALDPLSTGWQRPKQRGPRGDDDFRIPGRLGPLADHLQLQALAIHRAHFHELLAGRGVLRLL